jgi:hypothetical protein
MTLQLAVRDSDENRTISDGEICESQYRLKKAVYRRLIYAANGMSLSSYPFSEPDVMPLMIYFCMKM